MMKKSISLLLVIITLILALPIGTYAVSPKPAASGISASYKDGYNDAVLVVTVNFSSLSLCDKVTVAVGSKTKSITPTTKTKPIRQTATVSFPAYSFDPGTYTVKVTAKNSAGTTTKTFKNVTIKNTYAVSGKVLTVKGVKMNEFKIGGKYTSSRYVTINGVKKDMAAWQCYGYARYLETKIFGSNSGTSNNFTKLRGSQNVYLKGKKLKSIIEEAGIGSHIRTKNGHSVVVIGIDSKGFTISDANYDNKNTIRTQYYLWDQFCPNWGTIQFIEVKK